MKIQLLILSAFIACFANAQLSDQEIYDAKGGRIYNDTSYIYWLPFMPGERFLLVQAANSHMSHRNELSLDFKMKKGSKVCAARDGIVTEVKKDSDKGGLKDEYLSEGNHIFIRHNDGSMAQYWHLDKDGACVNVGDNVKKGQLIGLSGNTGYTAFPHLHFQVKNKEGKQILTRFLTRRGIIYLRPAKWYKCLHERQ
ncbi:M23 family metallopeptidase [Niastella caeni]|uniref:M23 family metallopeptidase n=1 Tax=Niastella caeni TaxID=2569763 RepID=A0A4S8H6N8_9BACT|nr:M23 family metallopeptidase [Niastella caeni]THU30460.1 M23 family metallopeptidase [Niastella caeni]